MVADPQICPICDEIIDADESAFTYHANQHLDAEAAEDEIGSSKFKGEDKPDKCVHSVFEPRP